MATLKRVLDSDAAFLHYYCRSGGTSKLDLMATDMISSPPSRRRPNFTEDDASAILPAERDAR